MHKKTKYKFVATAMKLLFVGLVCSVNFEIEKRQQTENVKTSLV